MEEKINQLIAQYYREQSRLIEKQDAALAAVTKVADDPAVEPRLVMVLRDAVHKFYRPEFEQVDQGVKLLEHLRLQLEQ